MAKLAVRPVVGVAVAVALPLVFLIECPLVAVAGVAPVRVPVPAPWWWSRVATTTAVGSVAPARVRVPDPVLWSGVAITTAMVRSRSAGAVHHVIDVIDVMMERPRWRVTNAVVVKKVLSGVGSSGGRWRTSRIEFGRTIFGGNERTTTTVAAITRPLCHPRCLPCLL
jgi:hypothetical protein